MLMQMPKSTVGKTDESKANPTKSVAYFARKLHFKCYTEMYYIPLCVRVCVQHKQLYFILFHVDLFNNSACSGQPFKILHSSPGQRKPVIAREPVMKIYCFIV